jgi:energy-coupling factor transporter transmembrane protein EcfT
MIRDITLGQYYQADSVIHKLDPRVKLFGTILYLVTLFIGRSVPIYACAILFLAFVIRLSKVPSGIQRSIQSLSDRRDPGGINMETDNNC